MKINKQFFKKLRPCEDRWKNYLKHYPQWEGSFSEFLDLEHIPINDKLWVFFKENKELESIQREFALTVSAIVVDEANIEELTTYHNLINIIYVSGELEELNSTDYRAAYWAAYGATYGAAYWAAYGATYGAADKAADKAADRAADRAADKAADRAADKAAEREKQLKIIKTLCEGI